MKPLRLAVALSLALAGSLATAPPAGAGGWAATVLDPLFARHRVAAALRSKEAERR